MDRGTVMLLIFYSPVNAEIILIGPELWFEEILLCVGLVDVVGLLFCSSTCLGLATGLMNYEERLYILMFRLSIPLVLASISLFTFMLELLPVFKPVVDGVLVILLPCITLQASGISGTISTTAA